MKNIIIVSAYQGAEKKLKKFEFTGMLKGVPIKKVLLSYNGRLSKGMEYLIYAELTSCDNGIIHGRVLKLKALDECWDRKKA